MGTRLDLLASSRGWEREGKEGGGGGGRRRGRTLGDEDEEERGREELDVDDLRVEGEGAGEGFWGAAYAVDDWDGGPVEEDYPR